MKAIHTYFTMNSCKRFSKNNALYFILFLYLLFCGVNQFSVPYKSPYSIYTRIHVKHSCMFVPCAYLRDTYHWTKLILDVGEIPIYISHLTLNRKILAWSELLTSLDRIAMWISHCADFSIKDDGCKQSIQKSTGSAENIEKGNHRL